MTAKNPWYYTIQSTTSRNSTTGLRPAIGPMLSTDDLIRIAAEECRREGTTLEDLAGIDWIEGDDGNFSAARPWIEGEKTTTATGKLNDDGRLFEIFLTSDDPAAYYDRAAELGLENDLQDEVIESLDALRLAPLDQK